MKRIILVSVISVVVMFSVTTLSFAGLDPKGLFGAVSKVAGAATGAVTGAVSGAVNGATAGARGNQGDLASSNTRIMGSYLAATQDLSLSLEKAGEAFGVKKEVLEKLAVVKSLKEGNINDKNLEKSRKASQEASQIIAQKMKETQSPSVESKKLMAESMIDLARGMQKESALVPEVQGLYSQAQCAITSASPVEMLKIKDIAATAFVLTKNIPPDLALTKNILDSYVKYAQANNITVPSNATCLLKGE